MLVDTTRALEFIRQHATENERIRLRHLLTGEPPSSQEAEQMLAGQRPDGGWAPFWAAEYSSLDATCLRLAQAEQAGIPADHLALIRARDLLRQRQRPADGCWEENAAVRDSAPPWARPGDLAARLYLTANCAFWLAVQAHDEADRDAATRGATAIAHYLSPDGVLPSFPHAHWLAAAVWYRLGLSEAADRALDGLARRLNDGLTASEIGWLCLALRLAGLPPAHPVISEGLVHLERSQRPDGGWASADGPERETHVTLEILRVLRLSGRW
jgi:hypothetical protein